MTKKTDPNYGRGEATVSSSLDPYIKAVKLRVRDAVTKQDFEIPLLPHVATQVLQLANNPNVSLTDIESLVKQDQVIAAKLIKTANSAFYRGVSSVVGLRDAMSRIGLRALKDIVFSLSLQSKVFKVPGYEALMTSVFEHSMACASISEQLAKKIGANSESAFLSGLLHDIGKPLLIHIVADWQRELVKKEKSKVRSFGSPPPVDEKKIQSVFQEALLPIFFNDFHSKVGTLVGSKWQLPKELIEVIAYHHTPEKSKLARQMTFVVSAANILCHHYGFGHEEEDMNLSHQAVFAELKMDQESIESFTDGLEEKVSSLIAAVS